MGARITCAAAIVAALWITKASAQDAVTVGLGSDCNIQLDAGLELTPLNTAIAEDASPEYRLALGEVRGDLLLQEVSTTIRGGYASCANARNGLVPTGVTIVRGSGTTSVVSIDGGPGLVQADPPSDEFPVTSHEVTLQQLHITGGNSNAGGGINIIDAARVSLVNSRVTQNTAEFGGGVRVRGALGDLLVVQSSIDGNSVSDDGGGVFCSAQARVSVDAASTIENNQAEFMGGGVFASNCRLEVHGTIATNRAGGDGGGIAAISKSQVDLIGLRKPMRVENNTADFRLRGEGAGGGLYISDVGTSLTAENTHIVNNRSGTHGGGLLLEGRATAVMMQAVEAGCGLPDCSMIAGNQVGLAGVPGEGSALLISDGAQIELLQTAVTGQIGQGSRSVFSAKRAGAALILESSLVYSNNQDTGTDVIFDISSTAELTIALATVAGNSTRIATIGASNARTELVGSVLMDAGNLEQPYFDENSSAGVVTARHIITYPAAGIAGQQIDFAGMEIFFSPEQGNFHLNHDESTQALARNQLFVGEYALQIPRDYRQQNRTVREFTIGVIDIGPDEYPLVTDQSIFSNNFELSDDIRFNQQFAAIFRHPRCTTCHAAVSVPEAVTTRFAHAGQDLATCAGGCHSGTGGSLDLSNWHAPTDLRLEGLSDRQLCQLAKRDAVPGQVSGKDHLLHDNLILWAVTSGEVPAGGSSNGDAQPASNLTVAGWESLVEDWFAQGAHCE